MSMRAFDVLRACLTYGKFPDDDVQQKAKELIDSIERDAMDVGFDTGRSTDDLADEVDGLMNEVDTESEKLSDALSDAEDDNDEEADSPFSGFGADEPTDE